MVVHQRTGSLQLGRPRFYDFTELLHQDEMGEEIKEERRGRATPQGGAGGARVRADLQNNE